MRCEMGYMVCGSPEDALSSVWVCGVSSSQLVSGWLTFIYLFF